MTTPIRFLSCIALALALTAGAAASAHAGSATAQLQTLDKTTYSGALDLHVTLYDPPTKPGAIVVPKRYPAQLLFERPDRFRLVLRPGAKDEFRAVAQAGIVRWKDAATGLSGKEEAGKVVDPLALALLGSAGELLRFAGSKDMVLPKDGKFAGARLQSNVWGTGVTRGVAWFSSEGKAVGFEFTLADGTRVTLGVLRFQQNVQTKPGDFEL